MRMQIIAMLLPFFNDIVGLLGAMPPLVMLVAHSGWLSLFTIEV